MVRRTGVPESGESEVKSLPLIVSQVFSRHRRSSEGLARARLSKIAIDVIQ